MPSAASEIGRANHRPRWAFQFAYVCAYRLMRTYWRMRRPTTHGALVTLWHDDKLLLVRNSYVPYYSLPGGYVGKGESGRAARYAS